MRERDKRFKKSTELAPSDWLFWTDEYFNSWRRQHDFPRIVEFLFDSLPYFSLWFSEQVGLTEEDLLFHGPSRFIRFYGEEVNYIEHNVGISLFQEVPVRKIVRYEFIGRDSVDKIGRLRVLRQVRFVSYIDWAFSRREWAFPNKVKDIRDIARVLTPSGRSCQTSDFLNSHSSIQLNIPLFMPSVSIESLRSKKLTASPPMLELLKLGGGEVEVENGLIGEKNLEFTNLDNLTLISPTITSFQNIAFSTLRNFKVVGSIHAMTFHQCSVEITVYNGGLFSCGFEYCDQKIDLKNSKLDSSFIRSRRLGLKLSDTEVLDCCFEYSDLFTFSSEEKKNFHKSAKMIFSHLGYPDLAGKHFLLERTSEKINKWEMFSGIKQGVGIRSRLLALLGFCWMYLQEMYWGYGEKPFNVILSSVVLIFTVSIYGYFGQCSSTYGDILTSAIYSFQSYTNISIMEIKQASKGLKLTGAIMSFFGLISVGLLVASLASKSKNYN